MSTSVTERFGVVLAQWQKASGPVQRPPGGEFTLALKDITIDEGKFRYRKVKGGDDFLEIPAVITVFRWHMDEHPVTGKAIDFPGQYWTAPLLTEEQIEQLPAGQQTRIGISMDQFKINTVRLLGYEPDDPYEALAGFREHVVSAYEDGNPVKARVKIVYGKGEYADKFDLEKVIRLIEPGN